MDVSFGASGMLACIYVCISHALCKQREPMPRSASLFFSIGHNRQTDREFTTHARHHDSYLYTNRSGGGGEKARDRERERGW